MKRHELALSTRPERRVPSGDVAMAGANIWPRLHAAWPLLPMVTRDGLDTSVSQLADRRLIKEMGRKETVGRPILYGTTTEFLQSFGLKNLSELPDISRFTTEN